MIFQLRQKFWPVRVCRYRSTLPVEVDQKTFPREVHHLLFCWAILVILDQPKHCLFVYFQDHRKKQPVTYMMSMYNLHIVNQMTRGWGNLHFFLEDFNCIISSDALRNPTRLLSLNLETPLQTRWCETEGSKFDEKIGNKNVGKLAFFGGKVCTWPCIIHIIQICTTDDTRENFLKKVAISSPRFLTHQEKCKASLA